MSKPSENHPCTAIILAGGNAKRMGRDKRFLKIGDEKLLERLVRLLKEHFSAVIISANDPEKLAYLGVPIIKDQRGGSGPLDGLTSALSFSKTEHNFVMAVDIPSVDMELVADMRSHLNSVFAVIPMTAEGQQEPLFAFYSKHCIPLFKSSLEAGEKAIHQAVKGCPVYHYPLPRYMRLMNLNRIEDYQAFLKKKGNSNV